MTLIIEPNTEKGKAQIEAIGWAQDQMNKVLEQYFHNEYRLMKGLRLEFRFKLDSQLNETIKVEVSELAPETEERLKQAIEQAKKNIVFRPQEPVKEAPQEVEESLAIATAPKQPKK